MDVSSRWSPPQYADPVSDLLDKWGAFRCRLFRESCVFHRGNYVKDLSRLGRDLNKVIIVDNSPASYIFHPDNAVSIGEKRPGPAAPPPPPGSLPAVLAGARGLVVRRHVRHGAAGPDPVLRASEQSGRRLRGPQAPRRRQLTASAAQAQTAARLGLLAAPPEHKLLHRSPRPPTHPRAVSRKSDVPLINQPAARDKGFTRDGQTADASHRCRL